MKNIIEAVAASLSDLHDCYERFHREPELSFQEYKTSEKIQVFLSGRGIRFTASQRSTAVYAAVGKGEADRAVALRADIDALPVQEKTNAIYASQNEGIMHACGHDVHTTCLLGALAALKTVEPEISGTVKGIFQPGEEVTSGGAIGVLKDNAFKNPDVSHVFGLHIDPNIPAGKIGLKSGPMMAAVGEFKITLCGKGGHAALPHKTVDPVMMAAEVITGLQKIVSRFADPLCPAVVSVTMINGGTSYNIIPEEVVLRGTSRALDQKTANSFEDRIRGILKGITESYHGTYDLEYIDGPPVLHNDPKITEWVREQAVHQLGQKNVIDVEGIMGGEDFAYYLQEAPGCFFRLGVGSGNGAQYDLHSPYLLPDKKAIETGAVLLAVLGKNIFTQNI